LIFNYLYRYFARLEFVDNRLLNGRDQSGGQELPVITRTIIDEAEIKTFKDESDFTGVAVLLLIEAGSYVCIAGNLYPANTNCWNGNQAVVGGLW